MKDTPFLFHFRKTLPASNQTETDELTIYYSLDRRVNVFASGEIAWSSLFRKVPTNAYTNGRMTKAGYTRSGKWKQPKYIKGKMDKRANK